MALEADAQRLLATSFRGRAQWSYAWGCGDLMDRVSAARGRDYGWSPPSFFLPLVALVPSANALTVEHRLVVARQRLVR